MALGDTDIIRRNPVSRIIEERVNEHAAACWPGENIVFETSQNSLPGTTIIQLEISAKGKPFASVTYDERHWEKVDFVFHVERPMPPEAPKRPLDVGIMADEEIAAELRTMPDDRRRQAELFNEALARLLEKF